MPHSAGSCRCAECLTVWHRSLSEDELRLQLQREQESVRETLASDDKLLSLLRQTEAALLDYLLHCGADRMRPGEVLIESRVPGGAATGADPSVTLYQIRNEASRQEPRNFQELYDIVLPGLARLEAAREFLGDLSKALDNVRGSGKNKKRLSGPVTVVVPDKLFIQHLPPSGERASASVKVGPRVLRELSWNSAHQ